MKSGEAVNAGEAKGRPVGRGAVGDIAECRPESVSVLVLMGGPSAEREVSLMSGREVSKALRRSGFLVREMDIGGPHEVDLVAEAGADVVFIALHGAFGEDGSLQHLLDERGILYTGSGSRASRLAMDKIAAKLLFKSAGLQTPPWRVVHRDRPHEADAALEAIGPQVVVKPVDEGSSFGVTIAADEAAYRQGLEAVFAVREQALVERRIVGRELTVGVLHETSLPIIEIVSSHAFYDYQAKYFDNATQYLVNPPLSADIAGQVRAEAAKAHQSLGCRDFSRPDFILDADGTPWLLEVNTIPGFTSHSLLPKSAAAAGIDFTVLCRRIIELTLTRQLAATTKSH